MKFCKCSFARRVLGDGCANCNPDLALGMKLALAEDRLSETASDLRALHRKWAAVGKDNPTADAFVSELWRVIEVNDL